MLGIRAVKHAHTPDWLSAVFVRGRMGHWNGDRDCEPARLL